MENYDESIEINCNPNWPHIPDHPCKILIIEGSGFPCMSNKFVVCQNLLIQIIIIIIIIIIIY